MRQAEATPIVGADRNIERTWGNAPLRNKVLFMLLLAVVGGSLAGLVEVRLGLRIWPLCIGLSVLAIALGWLAHLWIIQPFYSLIQVAQKLENLSCQDRSASIPQLSLSRTDEIGQISRVLHNVTTSALRDRLEAAQLRRTFDHRVATTTKKVTSGLRRIVMRDALTGLANRRFLDENLEPLVHSILAAGDELMCVMVDIDNFKLVNDTQGHAVGDGLLIFLAGLFRAIIRDNDYVARLGGDEFVVLMPSCPPDRVSRFTDQLRSLLRQHVRTVLPEGPAIDLSIGVASLERGGLANGCELLKAADTELYAAKRAGKGRTFGL